MKLSTIILILIVIQASIIMYDQVYSDDYEIPSYGSSKTIIWNFVTDPSDWSGTELLLYFASLTAVSGLIGVGVYLVTKSDTALFFGVFTFLLGAGAVPITSLYNVFERNVGFFGCSSIPCTPAILAWALTGGLLAILYILAVLEWWSNRRM